MEKIQETLKVVVNDKDLTVLKQSQDRALECKTFVIENNEQNTNSIELLKTIKLEGKDLEERRLVLTKPLNDTLKKINGMFQPNIKSLKAIEGTVKNASLAFMEKMEAIQLAEQAKAEAKAQALEDKRIQKLNERAAKASAKGNDLMAEKLKVQAENVYVPVVVKSTQVEQQKGISTSKKWKAEVIDKSKLPLNYLIVDQAMLNKIAIATKGTLEIPGVKFYPESVMSVRTA